MVNGEGQQLGCCHCKAHISIECILIISGKSDTSQLSPHDPVYSSTLEVLFGCGWLLFQYCITEDAFNEAGLGNMINIAWMSWCENALSTSFANVLVVW